jgi:hypothetical protein
MVGAVTTTPHDALFKVAFSKLRHARGLLRALLPEPLGQRIAWPTLRIESELLARQVGREVAEEIMTTAEMLRREGEARGKVQGKREALLLLLRQRFGRLPAAVGSSIDKAGAAELDAWFSQVLTASSLDEVLEAKVAVPPSKAMHATRAQPRSARQRARS